MIKLESRLSLSLHPDTIFELKKSYFVIEVATRFIKLDPVWLNHVAAPVIRSRDIFTVKLLVELFDSDLKVV